METCLTTLPQQIALNQLSPSILDYSFPHYIFKTKPNILKMKQQQHDINFEEDSEKKSESQMGFEPTTLRDLVGCSNHLSYWRLYGEQGPICGVEFPSPAQN